MTPEQHLPLKLSRFSEGKNVLEDESKWSSANSLLENIRASRSRLGLLELYILAYAIILSKVVPTFPMMQNNNHGEAKRRTVLRKTGDP